MIHPKEVPPEAILLAVYLELQNGESSLSLGPDPFKEPQAFGVCFTSWNLKLCLP